MNDLKESFIIMKAITTRTTKLKMTILCHAVCMLGMLFKTSYNKPLINLGHYGKISDFGLLCTDLGLIFSRTKFFSRNDRSLG